MVGPVPCAECLDVRDPVRVYPDGGPGVCRACDEKNWQPGDPVCVDWFRASQLLDTDTGEDLCIDCARDRVSGQ